jgi:OOP family OmpA-OmpF porin
LRHQKITTLLVPSLLCAFAINAQAQEQPKAVELVGKNYIGIHGMRMNTDDDRLAPNDVDYIEHANGIGAEFGHRFTEYSELRLSYTHLNLTRVGWAPSTPSGHNIAANYLYFPTKQNFYVMGGASIIDVIDSDLSANVGAGYRHYLSERSAVYVEGNGHYQFDNAYTDLSAQIGFVYFFGDTAKKVVRSKPKTSPAKPAAMAPMTAQILDSDKDGISDNKDRCKNTPVTDKVDNNGCTIFTEENDELRLQVNFDNSQAVVKPEYFEDIKVAADFLNKYPHTSLAIKGHTSSQGPATFNKKLSQQRADAIVAVLTDEFGIDASRLSAQGFGEDALLNMANNAAAHAENRRIEAKVIVKNKVAVKR